MPTIVLGYDKDTGFTEEWRDQKSVSRELFGKSDGAQGGRYWLSGAEASTSGMDPDVGRLRVADRPDADATPVLAGKRAADAPVPEVGAEELVMEEQEA